METTTSTETTTTYDRFQMAVKAIRKHGITTRQNARKCCRSCLAYDLGEKGSYAFTYGSQGSAYTWRDDRPVPAAEPSRHQRIWGGGEEKIESILWNFSDLATGKVIAEEFAKQGFTLDWDGSESQCVGITFK